MAKKKKFKLVDAILATVCITLVAESVAPTNLNFFFFAIFYKSPFILNLNFSYKFQ